MRGLRMRNWGGWWGGVAGGQRWQRGILIEDWGPSKKRSAKAEKKRDESTQEEDGEEAGHQGCLVAHRHHCYSGLQWWRCSRENIEKSNDNFLTTVEWWRLHHCWYDMSCFLIKKTFPIWWFFNVLQMQWLWDIVEDTRLWGQTTFLKVAFEGFDGSCWWHSPEPRFARRMHWEASRWEGSMRTKATGKENLELSLPRDISTSKSSFGAPRQTRFSIITKVLSIFLFPETFCI